MVSTYKIIILGAAALALLIPSRISAAGSAAGDIGAGLSRGISELGSIQIRPAFSPEFAPRFAPDVDLPSVGGAPGRIIDRIIDIIPGGDDATGEPGSSSTAGRGRSDVEGGTEAMLEDVTGD